MSRRHFLLKTLNDKKKKIDDYRIELARWKLAVWEKEVYGIDIDYRFVKPPEKKPIPLSPLARTAIEDELSLT